MKKCCLLMMLLMLFMGMNAQEYETTENVSYTTKKDAYSMERLKLDVYHSRKRHDCPVVVWFHGGGLEGGNKSIPDQLKEKGMVVVAVNYRLLPKVTVDQTIDNAAEAVAWVFRHIEEYGGSVKKIVVTGHSAGGYLSMMLCLNKSWLNKYDVNADDVMLYAPFSGQAVTHYNVRKMNGIGPLRAVIDEYAPIYWVRNDCPPLVLICGDRELELYGRYDENQYLARMMKLAGHQKTYLYELGGHGHGHMVGPAFHILDTHIKQLLGEKTNP